MVEKGKSIDFITSLIECKMRRGIKNDIEVFMPQIINAQEVVENFEQTRGKKLVFLQAKGGSSLYYFSEHKRHI